MLAADSTVIEELKWMGSPAWSCDGLIAVDIVEGAKLQEPALKRLVRAAIVYNRTHLKKNAKK